MTMLAALTVPPVLPDLLSVLVIAAGSWAAAMALYLVVVSVAALFYSPSGDLGPPRSQVIVLVPAHDEEAMIARCVGSLRAQNYPSDLYTVVVVADNCSDATAAVATAAGAHRVMVRTQPEARGKGQALRWALDRLLAEDGQAKAVVIVDADSIADRDFLAPLVRRYQAGAQVVQALYLLADDGPAPETLSSVAFGLVNMVRPAGREVLRLPTYLTGNGMLFAREVLLTHPWTAFTSAEDLEYSLILSTAGIKVSFAGDALLTAPPAPSAAAAATQQLRWQGGKVHLARKWIPRLIKQALSRRRVSLLAVAFDLATPPLALLAAAVLLGTAVAGAVVSTDLVSAWALVPWLVALGAIPSSVMLGLRAERAPAASYKALVRAPLYIGTMALRARHIIAFRGDTWVRTERRSPADIP